MWMNIGSYVGVDGNPFITGFETVLIFFFTAYIIGVLYRMVMAAGFSPDGFR